MPRCSSGSPTCWCEEAGITPLLHRLGVAPDHGERRVIRGVITESKAGREAILAKRVIDATGDADIAARAGAPYRKTPKEEMMAASVMFSMTRRQQAALHRRGQGRSADLRGLVGQRRVGLRDHRQGGRSCSRRSCASRSRRRWRPGSFRRTCTPSPAPGARSPTRAT